MTLLFKILCASATCIAVIDKQRVYSCSKVFVVDLSTYAMIIRTRTSFCRNSKETKTKIEDNNGDPKAPRKKANTGSTIVGEQGIKAMQRGNTMMRRVFTSKKNER